MSVRGARIGLVMVCLAAAWPGVAGAAGASEAGNGATLEAGIRIERASATLVDNVYYLDADIDFTLSRPILEALERGVPVRVALDIEILRERRYMWDETTTTLEQRYELDFHALTRSYVVRNLNIGTQNAFPTRRAALDHLGRIADLPMIDANLLEEGESWLGRVQARIDIDALPVPLRVRALVSPEWRLASGWHEWRF